MVDSFLVGILLLFSYFEDIMLLFLASIVSSKKGATTLIFVPIHDMIVFFSSSCRIFDFLFFQMFDSYVPSATFLYLSYLDSLPESLG